MRSLLDILLFSSPQLATRNSQLATCMYVCSVFFSSFFFCSDRSSSSSRSMNSFWMCKWVDPIACAMFMRHLNVCMRVAACAWLPGCVNASQNATVHVCCVGMPCASSYVKEVRAFILSRFSWKIWTKRTNERTNKRTKNKCKKEKTQQDAKEIILITQGDRVHTYALCS